MDLLACVDIPFFPLQLLARRRPDFAGHPVAVIDRDSPRGKLLFVDDLARQAGVRPGLTYAAALSITRELRADVVAATEIDAGIRELTAALIGFSPSVEPSPTPPGVFFIDASGLSRLHPSQVEWAERIRQRCRQEQLVARVAVGFSRYGTFAATRAIRDVRVFHSVDEERRFAREVPLVILDVDPTLVAALDQLGVRRLGEFLDLPAAGLRDRFGAAAYQLHRLAAEKLWTPLQPASFAQPIRELTRFDLPIADLTSILFLLQQQLAAILPALAEKGLAVATIEVELKQERRGIHREELRPAVPTADHKLLMNLVVLRFEALRLDDEVSELLLVVQPVATQRRQEGLFRQNPRRDVDAAGRAFARIRAAFGERSVFRAVLRDAHLPEAAFQWEPLEQLALPSPRDVLIPPLIRRIRAAPRPLAQQQRLLRDDGWLLGDLEQGAVVACDGPFIVSGGWWAREVHREYHLVRTARGDLLWVYYDRSRRRWFEQGRIE